MRPIPSPAPFKSEPKRRRDSSDGAATSPSPVTTSSPDAARIQSVAEGASPGFIGRLPLLDNGFTPTEKYIPAYGDRVLIPPGGLGISWNVG